MASKDQSISYVVRAYKRLWGHAAGSCNVLSQLATSTLDARTRGCGDNGYYGSSLAAAMHAAAKRRPFRPVLPSIGWSALIDEQRSLDLNSMPTWTYWIKQKQTLGGQSVRLPQHVPVVTACFAFSDVAGAGFGRNLDVELATAARLCHGLDQAIDPFAACDSIRSALQWPVGALFVDAEQTGVYEVDTPQAPPPPVAARDSFAYQACPTGIFGPGRNFTPEGWGLPPAHVLKDNDAVEQHPSCTQATEQPPPPAGTVRVRGAPFHGGPRNWQTVWWWAMRGSRVLLAFLSPGMTRSQNCLKELRVLRMAWRQWGECEGGGQEGSSHCGDPPGGWGTGAPPLPLFVCSGWGDGTHGEDGGGGNEGSSEHGRLRYTAVGEVQRTMRVIAQAVESRARARASGRARHTKHGPIEWCEAMLPHLRRACMGGTGAAAQGSTQSVGHETTVLGQRRALAECPLVVDAPTSGLFLDPTGGPVTTTTTSTSTSTSAIDALVSHAGLLGLLVHRLRAWLGAGDRGTYASELHADHRAGWDPKGGKKRIERASWDGGEHCIDVRENDPAPAAPRDDLGVPLRNPHRDTGRWVSPWAVLRHRALGNTVRAGAASRGAAALRRCALEMCRAQEQQAGGALWPWEGMEAAGGGAQEQQAGGALWPWEGMEAAGGGAKGGDRGTGAVTGCDECQGMCDYCSSALVLDSRRVDAGLDLGGSGMGQSTPMAGQERLQLHADSCLAPTAVQRKGRPPARPPGDWKPRIERAISLCGDRMGRAPWAGKQDLLDALRAREQGAKPS